MTGPGGYDYRLLILSALHGMPADDRIIKAYSEWMTGECDPDAFKLMLSHFAKYPFAEVEEVLPPSFSQIRSLTPTLLMLATALQGAPDLTPEQRLRVATITGSANGCPSYMNHKQLWTEALDGRFADQAHELLEQQGEETRLVLSRTLRLYLLTASVGSWSGKKR